MTTADITSKISALRAEIEKDSVSPENVGYLLQLVHDYTNSVKTLLTENLESLRKTIDNIEYDGLTSGGTIDGDLYVNGDARISDCLLVDGVANFGSSVIVNDGFWAHGGAYIYDGLEVFGPASFLNTLDVNGAIRSSSEIIAKSIDINEVFEADALSATINSIDVFEVNSSTVLLNSNVDITGNATIGGTLDVTGGVTADALTIGEVLISYDNRILGPEISANVLIVNGKTVFTDEIEVSEHVTIDRQGYITGVMYTGEVDCTGYTQTEGVFVVQSTEPMELDTNVNIYQGLNVTNNATVGGKLSVTGLIQSYETVSAGKGLIAYGGGLRIYSGGIDCKGGDVQIADSLCIKEKESYEYVQVLSIPEDSPVIYIGNFEDLDKGNYAGIALWGETSIHGNLNASSATIDTSLVVNGPLSLGNYAAFSNDFINLGDDTVSDLNIRAVNVNIEATNFNVDSSITVKGHLRVEESFTSPGNFNLGNVIYYTTGDDRVDFSTDILLQIVDGLNGREMEHGAIKSYSFGCFDYIRLLGLTKNAFSTDSIPSLEIGSAEDYAQDGYSGIKLFGDTHVDGNIHLGYHSNTALGVHTSLTTEFADTGMLVHLIGLQDTTNGKSLLSIGSKSYASATAPDAITLITSHGVGSIELIGNVYVPQTFRIGGATFTYDAINDCIVCDKRIANAGAGK